MKYSKTIFITITKGIIARNILRAGVLKKLAQNPDFRTILLLQETKNNPLPEYFYQEFKQSNVKIEILPQKKIGYFEKIFNYFIFKLVFSKSTKLYLRYHARKERRIGVLAYFIHWLIFAPLSRWRGLKRFVRWLDLKLFSDNKYGDCLEKYNPDLIFSTCIMSQFDIALLKQAKKRGIKTISMPRSWDNLDKLFFRVEPDKFLVQNEVMRSETAMYQKIDIKKIKTIGFPQFDAYIDEGVILPKEEYCRKKNFNPVLPILFLGSEGIWTSGDGKIFQAIIFARENGLIPKCNILIRPHFSECENHNYGIFSGYENVYIDDKYRRSDFFSDKWDPSKEDMDDFTNSLFHCSALINFASTLALDAACFNKPIISVSYGARVINGKDMSWTIYNTCHYSWVLKTGAVSLVKNENELMNTISHYLSDPEYKTTERKQLVEDLCYKLDGKSAERIAEIIKKMMSA